MRKAGPSTRVYGRSLDESGPLTDGERQVLRLAADGVNGADTEQLNLSRIAAELFIGGHQQVPGLEQGGSGTLGPADGVPIE